MASMSFPNPVDQADIEIGRAVRAMLGIEPRETLHGTINVNADLSTDARGLISDDDHPLTGFTIRWQTFAQRDDHNQVTHIKQHEITFKTGPAKVSRRSV